jgi:hypothetical protein
MFLIFLPKKDPVTCKKYLCLDDINLAHATHRKCCFLGGVNSSAEYFPERPILLVSEPG